jgi:hypothetical protein
MHLWRYDHQQQRHVPPTEEAEKARDVGRKNQTGVSPARVVLPTYEHTSLERPQSAA